MVKPLVGDPFSAFLVVKATKARMGMGVWVKILIPFCSHQNACDSWMLILPYMTLIGFYSSPFPDGKNPEQHVKRQHLDIFGESVSLQFPTNKGSKIPGCPARSVLPTVAPAWCRSWSCQTPPAEGRRDLWQLESGWQHDTTKYRNTLLCNMYTCIYICILNNFVNVYIYIFIYMYVCMYIYMYIYMYCICIYCMV